MRFTTKEDIELPADEVFAALTDFPAFERAALGRGAEVVRTGAPGADGVGQGWTVRFRHRGKERVLTSEITRLDPPLGLTSEGRVGGFQGELAFDLVALSPRRTRLAVGLTVRPKSLAARLLLQSLRLAKSNLTNRFKTRVRNFARDLETRGRTPGRA